MRRLPICMIALASVVPGIAHADCRPSFVNGATEVRLAAGDSMDDRQLTDRFQIFLRNDGNSECRLRLRVTRDLGASDPDFPNYSLMGPGGNVPISSSSPADVSTGSLLVLQPGGRSPVSYGIRIPVGWGMKSGDYRQMLVFSLSEDRSDAPLATQQVQLRLGIPATARIHFAGAKGGGGGARIDLGQLSMTARTVSSPFAVRILSTAGYQLQFASQNGGALRRTDGPETIAYNLFVDGRPFNMVTGDQVEVGHHTSSTGDVHNVSITVEPNANWHAGNYSDRVTVTVTPI